MRRALGICALLVLASTSAGCSFDIFEDVGSDPHPPTLHIVSLIHYVAPAADKAATVPPGRSVTWNSGGFTLSAGQMFLLELAYTDAGGDIARVALRDRDGALKQDFVPTDQTYFSGTSGIILGPTEGLELTGVAGPHRLVLYAEDSHLSRSEEVEFVITVVL